MLRNVTKCYAVFRNVTVRVTLLLRFAKSGVFENADKSRMSFAVNSLRDFSAFLQKKRKKESNIKKKRKENLSFLVQLRAREARAFQARNFGNGSNQVSRALPRPGRRRGTARHGYKVQL